MRNQLIIALGIVALLSSCQKKQDALAEAYRQEVEHLTQKWQIESAHTNATGNEVDNIDDVTYDWEKWNVEFFNNNAYIITEYAPDSSTCFIESGTWSMGTEGPLTLKGTEDLIDFNSGSIIDEGETDRHWVKVKNEDNELWIWIEDSYYINTGVFLKMVPF